MTWEGDLAPARLWATVKAPYLTAALFAMTPVRVEGLGTFAVDSRWRLYVDPVVLAGWTLEEVGTVLLHEVHHLIRDHAGRATQSDVGEPQRRRWNIAADLEINDDLLGLSLPDGGCLVDAFGLPAGELAETYFVLLDSGPVLEGANPDCGSGAHGLDARWEDSEPDVCGVSEGEGELIRQQVAVEVRVLAAAGKVAGGLARWAENLLAPKIDWRREFRSLVRRGVGMAAGASDYSYHRPSRRSSGRSGSRVLLPSMVRPVPRLAIVVDTSASMPNVALEAALAEVSGLLGEVAVSREPVPVLSCDAAVQSVQRVFAASTLRLAGGGGTEMGVGLAAAVALRPSPQVVVVLTDGLTPWPRVAPAGSAVIVGLIGDHGSGPAWAPTVRIPLGEEA